MGKRIHFLTDVGHITDDKRQKFILLSDALGLSILVTAMANRKPSGCTEATVFGPCFVEGPLELKSGGRIRGPPRMPAKCFQHLANGPGRRAEWEEALHICIS
ncbi:hypothetical protein J2W46_005818 [Paraburkholderia strydomiana]|nr:hypothetical protein [Paraburkholderia strydomiana]